MRKISDNLLNFTAAWETFSSGPYFATDAERRKGLYTWGFGHTGTKPPGRNITRNEALVLLQQDMADAFSVVLKLDNGTLNDAQFDAMVDLVFNVGPSAFYDKATGRLTGTGIAMKAGDVATLRRKLPQFRNQGGVPMLGIYRRAIGRLALFDGATWQDAEKTGRAVQSL